MKTAQIKQNQRCKDLHGQTRLKPDGTAASPVHNQGMELYYRRYADYLNTPPNGWDGIKVMKAK